MNISAQPSSGLAIPFDRARLDRLMDDAGIDLVIATSKHNVQYLLGGHRANFFDYMDATGVTRYLPVLVYPKGAPEKAAYIGHRLEKFQREVKPMWTPETQTSTAGSVDTMQKAVDFIRKAGLKTKRIAAEFGFLPYDASIVLRAAFLDADWVDALFVGAPAREEIRRRTGEAKNRVASGARVHAGGDRQSRTRRNQERCGRGAAPRRDQSRAYFRILPDYLRQQPQPRSLRPEMGEGRYHVDRFRRQLSRLYRRYLPHGNPGRAGCRAERSARRDREHPARGDEANPSRSDGTRNLRRR